MHSIKYIHSTPDGDDLVAYMARVSNPANQNNPSYSKLIQYLITHKHWSPFEMVNMCVKIETTRSVAAQILRHRSFSFQEYSQRYAQVSLRPELPSLRRQDTKNRQNSIDDLDQQLINDYNTKMSQLFSQSYQLYQDMLDNGVLD